MILVKKRNLITALTIVAVSVTSFAIGVGADSLRRKVEALECKDTYLTYNGDEFLARDANEDVVYPLIFNDSMYLPVRAVATIAGLKVNWEGKTNTAHLTSSDYVPMDNDGYLVETEINDTKADANIIPVDGGKFKGRVGETLSQGIDREDFYKFVVSEEGIVKIKITADPESDMQSTIIDTEDNEVQWVGGIPVNGVLDINSPLSKGTYYLRLRYEGDETTYKIDTKFVATPDDDNKFGEYDPKVLDVSNGKIEIIGAVGTAQDEEDTYKVIGFSNNSYDIEITWNGPVLDDCYVDFYDADEYSVADRVQLVLENGKYKVNGTIEEGTLDNLVIYLVSDNDTSVCNEYTLKVTE